MVQRGETGAADVPSSAAMRGRHDRPTSQLAHPHSSAYL
jgi:hypothetical protein